MVKMIVERNSSTKPIFILGLCLVVIALGIAVSYVIRNSRPEVSIVTPEKPLAIVRGIVAQKTSFHPVIKAQGTVKAKQQIELVPEVAGKIIWVSPAFAAGGCLKRATYFLK